MTTTYRNSLTADEQKLYDQMIAEQTANREHNQKVIAASTLPPAARRGVNKATFSNHYRVESITEHRSEVCGRERSCWVVKIEGGAFSRHGWIIGPRGKATQAY